MNGEIPTIPIISLAGIASLSDLLPEMPLPVPLASTQASRSLLFHPRVAEEAHRLLSTHDDALAAQLQHALTTTSYNPQHIILRDHRYENYNHPELTQPQPELLGAILQRNPHVFRQQPQQQQHSQPWNSNQNTVHPHHQQQQAMMYNSQQQLGYTSPATHVGAYTPSGNSVQGYAPQQSPAPGLPAQAAMNYVPQGSPYSTQTKLLVAQNNVYPQQPQQGYNSPSWGYEKPVQTPVPAQQQHYQQQQSQQHYPQQHHPQQQPPHTAMPLGDPQQPQQHIQQQQIHQQQVQQQSQPTPQQQQQPVPPQILDYNHQEYPNTIASTVPQERKEVEKQLYQPQPQSQSQPQPPPPVVQQPAQTLQFPGPIKSDPVATSSMNNSSHQNHRMSRNHSSGRPSYKEESDSDEGSKAVNKEEPVKEEVKPIVEEVKPKVKVRKEETPRKRKSTGEVAPSNDRDEVTPAPKKKLKRLERKIAVDQDGKLSTEELMETNTFQRFTRLVEHIFDATEDADLNAPADLDNDTDIPQEAMIPKQQLHDLCAEAAKLKSMGAMSAVPPERLVRLLNLLEKNIRDGVKISLLGDPDEDEEESKLWTELSSERVLRAVEAALAALHILTAQNMPKRAYLEDVIERIVQLARFQLQHSIYPAYDPVYRTESKKDIMSSGGSSKKKRAHVREVRDKTVLLVYHKMVVLVGLMAELLAVQTLTDTAVLHLSTVGVAPFFVENISELQLSALRLVTTIFSRYDKHRRLLLDDILASIARLPSSKRGLRTFRLSADQHIQMLTALVLQLIQCVLCLPEKLGAASGTAVQSEEGDSSAMQMMDPEVVVATRYDTAVRTAANFLSVFLGKCGVKNNEEVDYRPLFENFVQDLLSTVNKPEWPAAELLLSLLGKLLVQNFSNKNVDVLLRVASLEYLGVVAARLRKDAVTSQLRTDTIDQLLKQVRDDETNNAEEFKSKKHKKKKKSGDRDQEKENVPADKTEILQSLLLDYLAVNSQCDPAMLHARHFYVAMWYIDVTKANKRIPSSDTKPEVINDERQQNKNTSKKKKKKKRRNHFSSGSSESESSSSSSEDEDDDAKKPENENTIDCNNHNQSREMMERRKKLLLSKINPFPEASPGTRTQVLTTPLDAESSELITRFLASKRQFSQSFDSYLKHILKVLTEPAIAVRAKAMKCLTQIVESDPVVLARTDMQLGVHHSFLDQSTAVREAAVDLVGKFVLSRPELIDKYYTMLSARILDTGVSVRKRVIKIMKDICTECPDFPKIPEICVKMIRRVNDEEGGIKKLVMEVFQAMWFSPVREKPTLDFNALMRKVMNITDVVAACRDTGLDWLEQLLQQMFRPKEDKEDVTKANVEPSKALLTACQQIVDCLVENILRLEEASLARGPNSAGSTDTKSSNGGETKGASQRLVACMTTLYLFAKIRPLLLVPHAMTLQPYLSLRCRTQGDYQIISDVARTLEVVVPLLEHPSESFLAQLEEDAVKLILQHEKAVVAACLSCLGSVVNHVTRNFKLIRDCFRKYFGPLTEYKLMHERDPDNPRLIQHRPFFRRALFTVGLLLRHFDFTDEEVRNGLPDSTKQQVMEILLYFVCQNCTDMQFFTLQAIGSVSIRHYDFMLGESLKTVYLNRLMEPSIPLRLKVQVLNNIETYLQEEEIRMIKEDQQWSKTSKKENLKEMGDVTSGMASTVIQLYLKPILDCFIHASSSVRQSAFRVTQLILQQGLVHPVQIVPYLICISTDVERVSHSADKQLQEIEKKYPGFIHMKALHGIRLSYQLQSLIENTPKENSPVQSASKSAPETPYKKSGTKCSVASAIQESQGIARGFRLREGEHPSALNGFLYSLLRATKQQRRALVLSMLKQFDETSKNPLAQLLYLADNLASFPYQVIDEPLFLIHHIDIMVSVTGSNLLQGFRESLLPSAVPTSPEEEEDDEDIASIMQRLPPDTRPFEEFLTAAQGCLLLLMLKQHLKDQYGLTDAKITQYSPSEGAKIYEKNAPRKVVTIFMPRPTLHALKENLGLSGYVEVSSKQSLVEKYIEFKQLMLKIDPAEEDEEERLASAMRTYQVTESPVPTDVPIGMPIFGAAPVIPGVTLMAAPTTPMKTPRSKSAKTPRSPRGEKSSKKKSQKKRKRKIESDDSSDDSDCDPDFRA